MNNPEPQEVAMSQELLELIEQARQVKMTPEELEAQRINFAYGNISLSNDEITLDDVQQGSSRLKDNRKDERPPRD
jgi:hypothetical protein